MFGLDIFGTQKRKEAKLLAEAKARQDERNASALRIADQDARNKRNAAEQDARNRRYLEAQRKTAADRRENDHRRDDSSTSNLFCGNAFAFDCNSSYASPPSSSSYDSGSAYTPPAASSYSSSSYDSGSSYSSSSSCDSSSSSSSSSCGD